MPPGSALTSQLIDAIDDGACVLAPSPRSARWFKHQYAQYALAQGRVAWATPNIQSFQSFALQLWRRQSNTNERVLATNQCKLVWERIVADSKWSERLLIPSAAANSSFRSWERMLAWRIDRSALAQATGGNDEALALLEWSDRFSDLCEQRGWLPAASVPQRLLESQIYAEWSYLVTVGGDLLPLQQALCKHLADNGVRWEVHETSVERASLSVRKCETPPIELASAAQWAREQLVAGAHSIGIVVPNLDERAAHVRRMFAEVFAQGTRTLGDTDLATDRERQETSFAIANYHALADFPIVRAALDLLEFAVGRASSSLAGAILRSPFLAASTNEASERALADRRIRSQAREHYDLALLEHIATATNCDLLSQCLKTALGLRLTMPTRAMPSAMAEAFVALWRSFGWPGERALNSDDKQIVARLQEALGEFGALDELLGPLTFSEAVREFVQLVRNADFEPRSAAAPITIIDAHDVDGLRFDALWVAGMDETRWPPAPAPDTFLPYALQVNVGMPTANAPLMRQHARNQFERLQGMAGEVVFSWAEMDQDIAIEPSPWLQEIGTPQSDRCDSTPGYAARVFAARPSLEVIAELTTPAVSARRVRGGARIFELQSLCPFRAFAELRLGAEPMDAVAPDVDARERGTLMHAALADVWQTLGGSEGLKARSRDELTVLVRTALAKHAQKLMDGASPHRVRMLQIEQDIATGRMLALLDLDQQRASFRVFGRPETKEQANVGRLAFELRLDRMDELLDAAHHGQRVIVDYKTGNNVKSSSWISERPEQPQLPLYAVTHPTELAAVAFVTLGAKGVGYQGVARDEGLLPGMKAFDSNKLPAPHTGWTGLLQHWQAVIERLADEFADGRADVDPLPNACRYCHLASMCRIGEMEAAGDTVLREVDQVDEEDL